MFFANYAKTELILVNLEGESVGVTTINLDDGSQKGSMQTVQTTTGGKNWLKSLSSCEFVSRDSLVCVDPNSLSLNLLNLNQVTNDKNASFQSFPLTSFGLKSDDGPQDLRINSYPHQKNSLTPVFALELGNSNGYVVFSIENHLIHLVKILPKVSKLTIVPIDLGSGDDLSSLSEARFAAFVLISKPETLPQDDPEETQFKIAAFDLKSWEDLKSLNGQFVIKSKSPVILDKFEVLPFLKQDSQQFKHYKMLITTQDERIIVISPQGKVSWIREEALSSIISTQFIDFPLSELDASIEQTFGQSSLNIVTQFTARLSSQVYQLQSYLTSLVSEVSDLLTPVVPIPKPDPDSGGSLMEDADAKSFTRDYFGLHKMIVVLTEAGKVFSLDNLSGKILWSFYDPELQNHLSKSENKRISIHVQRTSKYYPHPASCTLITNNGLIISFEPITGVVVEKLRTGSKIKQHLLMSHVDDTHSRPLIYITQANKVSVYPKTAWKIFVSYRHQYFVLNADGKTGILEGLSFAGITEKNPVASVAWSLVIPVSSGCSDCSSLLSVYFKRQNEVVHSMGRVLGDRNVLYKYLNPNLAVVVTESEDEAPPAVQSEINKKSHAIDLYLVDAISGRIIYSSSHKRSKGPVHVIHSENSIIYSYYNEKHRRTEISAIDLYEGLTQTNSSAFSSFDRTSPEIIHNTFIFPTGMRTMIDTTTEKGITNKHVLIGLPSGGLLELPKAFLDPRRPVTPTLEHREEGLIPYIPELPIPSEGLINYNKTLILLKSIEVAPSGLESTCLVFTTGLDIFYTRVTPSKTFDILKDDFDHLLIAAVLVLLIAMAYVSKWLAARKSLKAAWT